MKEGQCMELTQQELNAIKEMGYTKEDIKKLQKERQNWHIAKVEEKDEKLVELKDDIENELNFDSDAC